MATARLVPHVLDQLPTDQCVNWPGTPDRLGYGRVRVGDRKVMAHRRVYELVIGPIPDGLTLDHLCRNRRCVNPAHLEPVTLAENIKRGDGIYVQHSRQETCIRGHAFDYTNTRGERICRTCRAERHKRWRANRAGLDS